MSRGEDFIWQRVSPRCREPVIIHAFPRNLLVADRAISTNVAVDRAIKTDRRDLEARPEEQTPDRRVPTAKGQRFLLSCSNDRLYARERKREREREKEKV